MLNNCNKKLSHLVVVTSNYPSPAQPTNGTFVRQFAHAVARQGVRCTVIRPVAIHHAFKRSGYPYYEIQTTSEGERIEVYRPRFLSLSARKEFTPLGVFSPSRFTLQQFTMAVDGVLRHHKIKPDTMYGHFLYLAGAAVVRIGKKMGVPAFPCVGEGELWTVRNFGLIHARRTLSSASGFIANSSALKQVLTQDLVLPSDRIEIFPNGTDLTKFYPRNRVFAREHFGLPPDQFLVAAVGNFLFKKGIVRVGEAIEGLEGVSGVFAGSGPVPPNAANTALCRRVTHDEMPDLLSACDLFALPTVIEGSCNSIVEAMACGLPIVSSIGEFNDDILTDDMSIRVDPMNVAGIRQAIVQLRDNPALRKKMGTAALERSRLFDVNDRARRILSFMEKYV